MIWGASNIFASAIYIKGIPVTKYNRMRVCDTCPILVRRSVALTNYGVLSSASEERRGFRLSSYILFLGIVVPCTNVYLCFNKYSGNMTSGMVPPLLSATMSRTCLAIFSITSSYENKPSLCRSR